MSKKKILTIVIQGLLTAPWGIAFAQGSSWDCGLGGTDWNCSANEANGAVTFPLLADNASTLPAPEGPVGPAQSQWVDLKSNPKTSDEEKSTAAKNSSEKKPGTPQKIISNDREGAVGQAPVSSEPLARGGRRHKLDEGLNWQSCGVPVGGQVSLSEGKPRNGDLDINSDAVSWQQNDQIALFSGGVEINQEDQHLESDWVRYSRTDGKVNVKGDFLYQSPSLRLLADEGEFYLNEKRGSTTGVKGYRILENGGRGTADKVVVMDNNHSHHENITYTTCRPGNSDWFISADELEINNESGWGEAKDATLQFMGTPILYTPYFRFPVDDRRMSGFLTPSIGSSNKTGIDVTAPYYLNLAPNYDATLYPRAMSDRGLMLGGEFRFLGEDATGSVSGEILPDDAQSSAGTEDTRGSLALRYASNPAPRWTTRLHADYVSDDAYLSDFGANLGVTSAVHMERTAEATYSGDFWSFVGRLQNYQTIDSATAAAGKPYSRLPQLLLNMEMPDTSTGLTYHFQGEYSYFHHEDAVFGQRLDVMPGVSYQILRPWGHMIPKVSGRYTTYALEDQVAGMPDNPDRTLPVFSLDSGLVFERPTNWLGEAAVQTLEPRLFYLFTPEEGQDDLPVFDTAENDMSFESLFRENRFSGADRQGDANQLTTALTSRFFSESTGREWLNIGLGEIFYFDDRNVQLPGNTALQDSSSSMVAEISSNFAPDWYVRTYYQWNPQDNDGEKSAAEVRYKDDEMRIVNLAYRYEVGQQEQVDAAFHWPVSAGWSLVGRWNYSMLDEKTLDRFGGFEYNSCCWAFRFVGRHFVNNDETTTGVFAQLELTGLGAIGQTVDRMIEEGVLGYEVKR